MRARTIREGSLGLFIIAGIIVFSSAIVWLVGTDFGKRSYQIKVAFANANGMKEGATVRYRGFDVGRIIAIEPKSNGVDVVIEVASSKLLMPKNVLIEANQSGLVGETSIDISPQVEIQPQALNINPLSKDCNPNLILCDYRMLKNEQKRPEEEIVLSGVVGVSFETLLRSTYEFSRLYTDPKFFNNLNSLTANAGTAASEIAKLSKELALLSSTARKELTGFSTAANSVTQAANQTSTQVGKAAEQYALTAKELTKLTSNVNTLVAENRTNIAKTLDSIGKTSEQLRNLVVAFNPTLDRVNNTLDSVNSSLNAADTKQLVQNLENLTANAAQASANLRDISKAFNDPTNLVVLQKTLDSARVTFENTQKITADLDQITGDPTFRNNLINLVNGLSGLVSSTQQLERQINVAQTLEANPPISLSNTPVSSSQPASLPFAPTVPITMSQPPAAPMGKKVVLSSPQLSQN